MATVGFTYKSIDYKIKDCKALTPTSLDDYKTVSLDFTKRRYNFLWREIVEPFNIVSVITIGPLFVLSFFLAAVVIAYTTYNSIASIIPLSISITIATVLLIAIASSPLIKRYLLFRHPDYTIIEHKTYLEIIPRETSVLEIPSRANVGVRWIYSKDTQEKLSFEQSLQRGTHEESPGDSLESYIGTH